jgi:hypothetical protein
MTSLISPDLEGRCFHRALGDSHRARRRILGESSSSFARESFTRRCCAGRWSEVMNGMLTSVSTALESSILAFSAASSRRWRASASPRDVDAALFLEFIGEPVDDLLVDVLAAQVRCRRRSTFTSITSSPTSSTEMSKVPPPKSKTTIFSSFFLLKPYASAAAVGSLMMRFTSRPAIFPASLVAAALRVVEVGRDGDDRFRDLLAELRFSIGLELAEDHRGDFFGAKPLVSHLHLDAAVLCLAHFKRDAALVLLHSLVEAVADEALDLIDRIGRVRHRLALREGADDALAVLSDRDDRRRRALPFRVLKHARLAALDDSHRGVGRAKVDTKNLCHTKEI